MKVCLVTGASSGIGLATALDLLAAGYVVYGAARRVGRMDALRAAGGHVVPTDLREPADLDRVVETVIAEQGRIDVLVNNAGTVLHGAVEDVPIGTAREYLDLNLLAPARLAQLVLPHMRAQGSGTIVNVSSVAGEIAMPLGAWYYAAKHALEALSDTLRMEAGEFGIDVVIIQPGIIKTEFGEHAADQLREFSGDGAYRHMANAMAARTGSGPDQQGSEGSVVAEVIRKAIEADRPETRYAVGLMAEDLLQLGRTLPDRAFDEIVLRSVR
ncbi:oxidoreductase [Promicromonospora sp. Populi]|uniref:oxidoreductase n=1 Tax=Promicromonospora sp. Populi TaxID=3239420 RepID=UPI0034E27D51